MAERNKKALVRGLDSIFGQDVSQFLDEIQSNGREAPGRREIEVAVSEIRPNPYQPRKEFDEKALNELADSIKLHGIFTPLLVRKSVRGYELITGERRLRAARIAGLTTVPAISVDFTEEQMMEISILENVQREDLNPIEEASAYESLISRLGYTQEKLAQRVGKSREYCANMLRLLKLPADVQDMVTSRRLTMGHVRPLLALKDENEMYDAALHVLKNKMSVREVEAYVRELNGGKKKHVRRERVKDPWIRDLEYRLSGKLGTKVEVTGKALSVSYSSTDDLNRILELLGCLEEQES